MDPDHPRTAAVVTGRCLADPTHHSHRYTGPALEIIEALPAMSDQAGLPRDRPNPPPLATSTPGSAYAQFASVEAAATALAPGLALPEIHQDLPSLGRSRYERETGVTDAAQSP